MWARRICLTFLGLLAVATAGHAQDALSTQRQLTLGGNDQRGLPDNLPPPFGSALVTAHAPNTPAPAAMGGGAAEPAPSPQARGNFDPNYVVQPGDAIDVQLFGATSISAPSTVNATGQIFIPTVGPVDVAGTTAANLPGVVGAAVDQVYVRNVKVYAALLSAIPVKIFVTGEVAHPGQYSASSTDSVVAALDYAGGVNPASGSYRDITILRDGSVAAHVDLYDFLLRGQLPAFPLRNGNSIVVGPQGLSVSVFDSQRGDFRYELGGGHTGGEVLALAPPRADTTNVSLLGMRDGRPTSFYLTLSEFSRRTLMNGDVVRMVADSTADRITVTIDGRVDGPTTLVLDRTATLQQALSRVPVSPEFADIGSVYLRRASVAVAQKRAIDEAVSRLQLSIASAPLVGDSDASIRTQEAALVDKLASEAHAIEPEGRVVVSRQGKVSDIRLENGDVIVIPPHTDLVDITGEVSIPQAVAWDHGLSVDDYLKLAGGPTPRGDTHHVIVQRASGEIVIGAATPVHAGDRILVLPKQPNELLPILKDITAVIYQIAVGVGVALRL